MPDDKPVPYGENTIVPGPIEHGPPPPGEYRTIAHWEPEDFLAGKRAEIVDPELRARMDRQRAQLRKALVRSVAEFRKALDGLSDQTQARLGDLAERALAGDERAMQLFLAMYGELVWQAIRP
jgi:hypothetical protein